ncbi:cytochrome c oxidase assembly protein [Streptomyces sp. AN091965]|uniref:cytochrome c oxidase assembly protein n=1 Tax=Streptomyces sp. AN091965 TaxID=2927803 RepID=UPI001F610270|nr:cytochrome c oxidase assembly protein [Streptomyces sp. AN091965]MCI3927822.1 cytochrome c oxidase assembly protein [Streptomyces sp. AN091965]
MAHTGPGHGGTGAFGPVAATLALLTAFAYLLAAARLRRRGDAWPRHRDASFAAGSTALAYALTGPLPGGPFTAHMSQHLTLAMAAPLLLVLARPFTLALRTLPPGPARRALLATARSRLVTWLLFPPLTAVWDLGGLWLLHRTGLLATSHHQPLLNAAIYVHVLVAGSLFTFTVCQLDPVRHRWSPAWRGTTVLAAGWAHAVLAKSLYTAPPPGTTFTPTDLHTASQLMYYGGDLAEIALATVLATQWYATTGRTYRRTPRVTLPDTTTGQRAAAALRNRPGGSQPGWLTSGRLQGGAPQRGR